MNVPVNGVENSGRPRDCGSTMFVPYEDRVFLSLPFRKGYSALFAMFGDPANSWATNLAML